MVSAAYSVCKRIWNQRSSSTKKRSLIANESASEVPTCMLMPRNPSGQNERSAVDPKSSRLPRMIRPCAVGGAVAPPTQSGVPKYLTAAARAFGKRGQKRPSVDDGERSPTTAVGTTNIPTSLPSPVASNPPAPSKNATRAKTAAIDEMKLIENSSSSKLATMSSYSLERHSTPTAPKQVLAPPPPAQKQAEASLQLPLPPPYISKTTTAVETQTEPMTPGAAATSLSAGSVTIMVSQPAASVRIAGSGCLHRNRRQQKVKSMSRWHRSYRLDRSNSVQSTPDLVRTTAAAKQRLRNSATASSTPPANANPASSFMSVEELKTRLEILEQAVVPLLSTSWLTKRFAARCCLDECCDGGTDVGSSCSRQVQTSEEQQTLLEKGVQCQLPCDDDVDRGRVTTILDELESLNVRMNEFGKHVSEQAAHVEKRVVRISQNLVRVPQAIAMMAEAECGQLLNGVYDRINQFELKLNSLCSKMSGDNGDQAAGVSSSSLRNMEALGGEEKQRRLSLAAPSVEELSRSMLENEVTSLRSIFDLKMDELSQMRCKCDQLKAEAAEASRLRDRVEKCEREKENLVAMIRIQQEKNRTTQHRLVRLNERFTQESNERKRLQCENETLKFNHLNKIQDQKPNDATAPSNPSSS